MVAQYANSVCGNATVLLNGAECMHDGIAAVCFNGFCGPTANDACYNLQGGAFCRYAPTNISHDLASSTCKIMGHKGKASLTCGSLHHGHTQLLVMFFPFFALVIGTLLAHYGHSLPVPYTVLLLVFGMIIGEIETELHPHDDFSQSAIVFASFDPHLMLFVFLPPLLFESAFNIKWHVFKKTAGAAMLLATSGVVLASLFTALCVKGMFYPDWDWTMALLFGCILSATDPVAVVALLKELGAKESLSTMIEGESLLNDGTAVVIFVVLFKAVQEGGFTDTPQEVLATFFQMAIGGPLWGIACGGIFSALLYCIVDDAMAEVTMTLAGSYLCFFVAEFYFQVSGVLAIVAYGLFMGTVGRTYISPSVEEFLHEFWETIAFIANTLVFILAGLILPIQAFHSKDIEFKDVVVLGGVYIVIHIARALVVRMHLPAINRLGYSFSGSDAMICVWGGLRGAVGLALALVIALDPRVTGTSLVIGHKILFHVSGIVMLTLLVNATTIGFLVQFFNMDKVPVSKEMNFVHVQHHISQSGRDKTAAMQMENVFSCALWGDLNKYQFNVKPVRVASDLSAASASGGGHMSLWEQAESSDSGKSLTDFHSKYDGAGAYATSGGRRAEARFREARRRFLLVCKASYWHQFREGLLGREAVRSLEAATDNSADNSYDMHEWEELKEFLRFPSEGSWLDRANRSTCMRFFGMHKLVQKYMFLRMQLGCDIAQGFLVARDEALRLMMEILDDEQDDCYQALRSFALKDTAMVTDALTAAQGGGGGGLSMGAEITAGIHTHHAARSVLNSQKHLIGELHEEGLLDSAEKQRLDGAVAKEMTKLGRAYTKIPVLDKFTALHNVPWLRGISQMAMAKLLECESVVFTKGDVLMEKGEEDESVFIVARGSVDVMVGAGAGVGGGAVTVPITLGQGSCIGEMAWITKRPRVATVRARTDGQAYKISGDQLRAAASAGAGHAGGSTGGSQLVMNLCQYSGKRLVEQFLLQEPTFDAWSRRDLCGYLSKWKAMTVRSDDYVMISKMPIMLVHGSCRYLEGEVKDVERLQKDGEEMSSQEHGPRMMKTSQCSFKGSLSGGVAFTCLLQKGTHVLVPPPDPPVTRKQLHRQTMKPVVKGAERAHGHEEEVEVPEETIAEGDEEEEEGEGEEGEEEEGEDEDYDDEDEDEDEDEEEDEDEDEEDEEDQFGDRANIDVGHMRNQVDEDSMRSSEVAKAYERIHTGTGDRNGNGNGGNGNSGHTIRNRVRFDAATTAFKAKPKASRRNTRFTASAMEFYMSAAHSGDATMTPSMHRQLVEESEIQEKMGANRTTLSTPAAKRSSILPVVGALNAA